MHKLADKIAVLPWQDAYAKRHGGSFGRAPTLIQTGTDSAGTAPAPTTLAPKNTQQMTQLHVLRTQMDRLALATPNQLHTSQSDETITTSSRCGMPSLADGTLWDVFADPPNPAASGFVLSQIQQRKGPILWIQDRLTRQEIGGLSLRGMHYEFGRMPNLVLADVNRIQDVLWAMEEGLRSQGLAGVIGEIWGDANALDFTATKRLSLRAAQSGVPAFLLRYGTSAHLSAARERWCVSQKPSTGAQHNTKAPGNPIWHLTLFRSRSTKPSEWEGRHDRKTHRLHLSAPLPHGALATPSDQAATG